MTSRHTARELTGRPNTTLGKSLARLPQPECTGFGSSNRELQPCWLLRLSPELLHKIMDECPQISRARMARTASTLHQISTTALFRDVSLPPYDEGESFREACRSNPDRKNYIKRLAFPSCMEWCEWLSWNSATSPMPALHTLCAHVVPKESDTQFSDSLEVAFRTAPNIQSLRMMDASLDEQWTSVCLGRTSSTLRRLDLADCEVSQTLLATFARSFPAVSDMSLTSSHDLDVIDEACLEALASFSQLTQLRMYMPIGPGRGENSTPLPMEFSSLVTLSLANVGVSSNGMQIFEGVSMPRLRQFHLAVNNMTDIEVVVASLLAGRLPQLSAFEMEFMYRRPFRIRPFFGQLEKAGFTFELKEREDIWSASRGDHKYKPFPE